MSHKLNKIEKEKCIDFLFLYGDVIENHYGSYDWDNKLLVQFCKQNNMTKKGNVMSSGFNFFWFEAKKGNHNINDIAHHFLRHIRNAIAHSNFYKLSKNGKRSYELKDYNKKRR